MINNKNTPTPTRKELFADIKAAATLIGTVYGVISTVVYIKKHHQDMFDQYHALERVIKIAISWLASRFDHENH
jgi:hypothetical protein